MSDDYDLFGNINAASRFMGVQVGKTVLKTHPASACADDPACCIHKPSDHPLKDAPMNWRGDRGLMERICDHGVGHPDPDDLAYKARTKGERSAYFEGIHGCDGCCG